MCDTNLKFGPEWLRALTEPQIKNCEEKITYTPPLANMKLAEFRYGKEEMLALFSPELDPPKEIIALGSLYVDSCQFPLNLIQMGPEEARAWQQKTPDIMSNNSSNRPFSTGPPTGPGGRAGALSATSRGRGRGRAANFPYFDRNRFDDPDSDNSNGQLQQPVNGIGSKLNKGDKGGWSDSKGKPIEGSFSDAMKSWRDRKAGENENTKVWGGAGAAGKSGIANGHANSNMNWRSRERNGNTDEPSPKPRGNDWFQNRGRGGIGQHHLPEWVTNSNNVAEGGFDDNGKFRPDEYTTLDNVPKWTDDEKWIEEEVEPEIINQQAAPKPVANKQQPKPPTSQENKPTTAPTITPQQPDPSVSNKPVEQSPAPPISEAVPMTAAPPMPAVTSEIPSQVNSVVSSGADVHSMPALSMASMSMPSPSVSLPQPPGMEPNFETIKWTYLDPQGQIQGPFRHDEMLEWSKAGYFPTDLLIKRNIDGRFIPLSEMSLIYGRNPFIPGPTPRGISNVEANEHLSQQQYLHHLIMQQQQQQQLLAQQQLLLFHQQNPNINNLLLNKSLNSNLMKPGLVDPMLSNMVKQPEDLLNLALRGQNFNLSSPEVSTPAAPAFDPIKSLLNQLKESTNNFSASSEEKESPLPPAHPTQLPHQMQQQPQQLGHPIQQQQMPFNQTPYVSQPSVQISQQQMSSMQMNQQQQAATTMAIDKQLHAQLASIGVHLSKPTEEGVVQTRLSEASVQETRAGVNEKRQAPTKQKEKSPSKSVEPERTPSPAAMSQSSSESSVQLDIQQTTDENLDDIDFKVPRNNEKKKTRKAEIKKKAKSKADVPAAPYIPGLPGSQVPTEQLDEEDVRASQEQEGTPAAEEKSAAPNKKKVVTEQQQQPPEPPVEVQIKPAPWANCKSPENKELSLHDIQKIEAEKDRKRRAERQQQMEIEARERRELELQRKNEKQAASWSYQASNNNVKSLAEIQAEEETKMKLMEQKQSKDQNQMATKLKKNAQRAPDKPTSWAGKIAASIPPSQSSPQVIHSKTRVVAPATDGFWESGPSLAASSAAASKPAAAPATNNAAQKGKEKKVAAASSKGDIKADLTTSFKSWCRSSLEKLSPGPDVDIDTFLGFLQDVESPYEVNDYIKSYIGEGKAHKKFGTDYLERRSQLKNMLKKSGSHAKIDDFATTATNSGQEAEFQEAPRKGKKKSRNSKTNLNHLLGFTSAPGHGINRGELDLSM